MTLQELQDRLNLSDRMNFLKTYLQPAIESGVLEMTIPDKPKSRDQRYRLTNAGPELKISKGKRKEVRIGVPDLDAFLNRK